MEWKNINLIILLENPWYYVSLYLWKLTITGNEKWPLWNTCTRYKDSTISYLLKKWEPCEPFKWQFYFLCLLQGLRCHYCQQNRWNPRGRCRNRMWSLLYWEVRRWVSCNLKAFQNYDTSVHQTKVVSAIVVKVDRCDMYWKKKT